MYDVEDRVKCIDDYFIDSPTNPFKISELNLPEKDKVYIVRDIVESDYGDGLRLKEIKNKEYYFDDILKYNEPIFAVYRFELLD